MTYQSDHAGNVYDDSEYHGYSQSWGDHCRIVACVNYCQGATNEELAGGLLGGLRASFKALEKQRDDAAAEAEALRAQRDELIATLEQVGRQPFSPSDCGARWDEGFKTGWHAAQNDNYDLARAALAKVQP